MKKNILVTGSTDGIGLATVRLLLADGHRVLLHGRNGDKLSTVACSLQEAFDTEPVRTYAADLSTLAGARALADKLRAQESRIDVLINNAGVFRVKPTHGPDGIDLRFVVNTIAPWLLTRHLTALLADDARILNLSSAAQEPVDLEALVGRSAIADDFTAYAQSKLALTAWSMEPGAMGLTARQTMLAVNPGSLLASKMVREGFGATGKDINIGAEILHRLALEPTVKSGHYFDNDIGRYAEPHAWVRRAENRESVISLLQALSLRG